MEYSKSLTCFYHFGQIRRGRIQDGTKIDYGVPFYKKTSSSDRKATATNRIHSNDLEACWKKCCYFWFHSEVYFLTRFGVILDFIIVISTYFLSNSLISNGVKCFIYINFV